LSVNYSRKYFRECLRSSSITHIHVPDEIGKIMAMYYTDGNCMNALSTRIHHVQVEGNYQFPYL